MQGFGANLAVTLFPRAIKAFLEGEGAEGVGVFGPQCGAESFDRFGGELLCLGIVHCK